MIAPDRANSSHPGKDSERLQAERRAAELGADAVEVSRMDDDQLRRELFHLSRPTHAVSCARRTTLLQLAVNLGLQDDVLAERLADLGISVADDGLLEMERITAAAAAAAGDLPVAMYHHTSTSLLGRIAREGLRVGRQTNFFNTQAGVYVSTMRAGQPVSIYSARAARVHGGDPAVIRVRRKLSQIVPDPDDADLDWAQGRQYITPGVPPDDLLLEPDAACWRLVEVEEERDSGDSERDTL